MNAPKIENINEYWFNNNPALTHFLHALSTLFEEGEGFFMKSVTHYLQSNPEYRDQIIKFCKEERAHSQMHRQMNASFKNKALLQKLEKRTGTIIRIGTRFLSNKQKLATTAALEHITCSLALELLKRKDLQALMTSDIKDAWLYHAIDESSESHRTLAYNLYQTVSGNTFQRHALMLIGTGILSVVVLAYWSEIMADDTFKGFPEAIYLLFIKNGGFITNILPKYLEWFSPNYQP